nr:MAG TPA: hypothetical protein [Caudoviricetes sp.]
MWVFLGIEKAPSEYYSVGAFPFSKQTIYERNFASLLPLSYHTKGEPRTVWGAGQAATRVRRSISPHPRRV